MPIWVAKITSLRDYIASHLDRIEDQLNNLEEKIEAMFDEIQETQVANSPSRLLDCHLLGLALVFIMFIS